MDGWMKEGVSGERKRGRLDFIYVRGTEEGGASGGVRSQLWRDEGTGRQERREEGVKQSGFTELRRWRDGGMDGWKDGAGGECVASTVSLNFGPWTALGGIGLIGDTDETGRGQLEGRDRCGALFPPSAPKLKLSSSLFGRILTNNAMDGTNSTKCTMAASWQIPMAAMFNWIGIV